MKKIILGCLLFCGMISGLYAQSLEDEQFKQYVELTKKSPTNPKGMSVSADYTYRIIYAAMPLPHKHSAFTPQVIAEMKKEMIRIMKTQINDVKVIKSLKINFVFTYITSDKNIIVIPLSYNDF
ncbi:MAG: hypothetical protein IKB16_11770 [Lentisphaeria bacterium]|nr:hypothetical protein [Lentisphaeria bacterium]